jgi:Ca2+-binding RTX toxin-like protein
MTIVISAAERGFYGYLAAYYATYVHPDTDGYIPPDVWALYTGYQQIAIVEGTSTVTLSPSDNTLTYSVTATGLTFYEMVYEDGAWRQGDVIGTATMPTLSYTGTGTYYDYGDGSGPQYYLQSPSFEAFFRNQDLTFNGSEADDTVYADDITGNGYTFRAFGRGGNDFISGSTYSNNTINGGAGDDYLRVYRYDTGSDAAQPVVNRLIGGIGNDRLELYDDAGDSGILDGGGGRDSITIYGRGQNIVTGGDGDDYVYIYTGYYVSGQESDEAASNTVSGGRGNDFLYINDLAGDMTVFDGGAGRDSLQAYGDGDRLLSGGDGDDYLYTEGAGSTTVTGGAGNDTIYDYGYDEDGQPLLGETTAVFSGRSDQYSFADPFASGTVTVSDRRAGGPDGDDRLYNFKYVTFSDGTFLLSDLVGKGVTIEGTEGDDVITPVRPLAGQPRVSDGGDLIFGRGGNDRINGGLGADTVYGGAGDDTVTVDTVGDVVSETDPLTGADTGGRDTVIASVSFTLGAFIENLRLIGQVNGTGNELANSIVGSDYGNVIDGGGGDDRIDGRGGFDILRGGDGNDRLFATGDYYNYSNGEAHGGAGNDTLEGSAGSKLFGGAGNDVYLLGTAAYYTGAVVIETDPGTGKDAGGIDVVRSSLYDTELTAFVENLTLLAGGYNGRGNNLGNVITGNRDDNQLFGGGGGDRLVGNAGNDTLDGGAGRDGLIGGDGSDVFVLRDVKTPDVIRDFVAGEDQIWIDGIALGLELFVDFFPYSLVDPASFVLDGTPTTAGPTFLFDSTTHRLSFDSDGTGGKAAFDLCVADNAILSASDLLLIG